MDLAERVRRLEFWMELLVHVVDPDVKPFSLVIIDRGFGRQRMRDILWCMDAYRARLERGEEFSTRDFEESIYEIVPERWRDHHLVQDIVTSLNQEGRYTDVYQALKERGMNI